MEENKFDENLFPLFPKVNKISPKLLADNIIGMTAEETCKAMKEMFDNFENQTGYKPVVISDSLPVKVLIPKENKKDDNTKI